MNKPSTVIRQEFVNELAELMGRFQLPAFVMVDVMEEALQVAKELARNQYMKDKAAWDDFQKKEAEKTEMEKEEDEGETA